jgi:hypothetical protein
MALLDEAMFAKIVTFDRGWRLSGWGRTFTLSGSTERCVT